MTALMLLSLVLVAIAPNFTVLMLARGLLGITIGGFWSLATSVIMRLVPEDAVPRALSIMFTGQAISAAFAAPFGAWLEAYIGWRGVFWLLVPIVVLTLIWQLQALPSLPARQKQSLGTLVAVMRRGYFARGLIALTFIYGSAFMMFTYLRPFLEQVTGADVSLVGLLFLILGVSGFAGTWACGRFVPRYGLRLLVSRPLVMGLATLGLILFGTNAVAVAVLLAIWGAMNTAVSIIWFGWMSRAVVDEPEAAGSLMVAVIQGAILIGAFFGGLLIDGFGIRVTYWSSVGLAAIAVLLIGSGRRFVPTSMTS